jgi:hypothetical protein
MDNGVAVKYKMKRSMIFIRPSKDVPFHVDVDPTWIDRMKEATKEFTEDCMMTHGTYNDDVFYCSFWLREFEDYSRMTDCLYDKGQIKEVFKDSMRYTKKNGMAFAMPSVWMNKRTIDGKYVNNWYTNKKTRPDGKFLEELKETFSARHYALKGYMELEDCVMNCAFYDWTHNTKHSYFLFTKRDDDTEKSIDHIRKNASENYEFKKKHNFENGVEYIIQRDVCENLEFHDFSPIPEGVFTDGIKQLKIPILL